MKRCAAALLSLPLFAFLFPDGAGAAPPAVDGLLGPREWAGETQVRIRRIPGPFRAAAPTPHPATQCTTLLAPAGLISLPLATAVRPGRLAASLHRFTPSVALGIVGAGETLRGLLPSVELSIAMEADGCGGEAAECDDRGGWKPFYRSWRLSAKAQVLDQDRHGLSVAVSWVRVRPAPFVDRFGKLVLRGEREGLRIIGRESRVLVAAQRDWKGLGGGGAAATAATGGGVRAGVAFYQSAGPHLAVLVEADTLDVPRGRHPPMDARVGVRVPLSRHYKLDLFFLGLERLREENTLIGVLANHLWVGVGFGGG